MNFFLKTKYQKPKACKMVVLLASLLFLIKIPLNAQKTDSLFKIARDLAYKSRYDTAIALLDDICNREPRNGDYRLFLARVRAWSKDFSTAEQDAQRVLKDHPTYRDALHLLSDIYLWSKNWQALDNLTQNALSTEGVKDSAQFIKNYAMGLMEQKRYKEALNALKPMKDSLAKPYETAKSWLRHQQISWHGSYYRYPDGIQPDWKLTSIEYTNRNRVATFVASVNFAARFGSQGVQYMAQAYPKIGKKAYAWLIAGISDGKAFPNGAYGASFFLSPKKGWEAELGMRLFTIKRNDENASVLRGGLAKQWGKNRVYYSIARITGSLKGTTHSLSYRKYFADELSYWQTGIGTGASTENVLSANFDNFIINSRAAHTVLNYWFGKHWRGLIGFAWEQNDNSRDTKSRNRWIIDAGVGYRF